MIASITWFTIFAIVASAQQIRYWRRTGNKREAWVFLGWMIAAWGLGIALIAGVEFPAPTKPILPQWK
ncbi:hypothetical protein [Paenibacillus methanolicus]|uniref:Uncharacterized protein n=1 Tax=Paenibacillus methanolicus TaxID=582686 RepID=A0A5S5C245_9BACL|nr:hypothetical protein [Paenibacillus methanolicus]TYP72410.1 hypothetical protein BCM02_10864 [Paenibacillus methanolicus]